MSYRYFAYGSNLSAEHFAEWAKEHGYAPDALSRAEALPAVLDDHELVLGVPSRYWMGAVGTVVPRAGSSVHGVLFILDDAAADMIRHKEGVASGLYREVESEVRLGDSPEGATLRLIQASLFRAADERTASPPPPPSQRWLDTVAQGARAHELPEAWIRWLEGRKA